MEAKEFIEKWNVGYEDLEQKEEFAKEMEADLKALQDSEWARGEKYDKSKFTPPFRVGRKQKEQY